MFNRKKKPSDRSLQPGGVPGWFAGPLRLVVRFKLDFTEVSIMDLSCWGVKRLVLFGRKESMIALDSEEK